MSNGNMIVGGHSIPPPEEKTPVGPGFKRREADSNRKQRRAMVKALGHRQFKKLYRKALA